MIQSKGDINMTNLKLITTETFGDLSCNFYRNMNDDILLTREQIGLALEYVDPINSIYKIHNRHKDRLDNLSICLPDGLGHEIYYYTQRGIMEICRWSKSDKANQFMDWVLDIMEKYRNNELVSNQIPNKEIVNTLNNITTIISSNTDRLTKLEENLPKEQTQAIETTYKKTI